MIKKTSDYLEESRILNDPYTREASQLMARLREPYGQFLVVGPFKVRLFVIAAGGHDSGWEHVSVSVHRKKRCPTWGEMCFIKDLFWPKDEMVIQYHPAKVDYVNIHPLVLHLWRPTRGKIPMPPKDLI